MCETLVSRAGEAERWEERRFQILSLSLSKLQFLHPSSYGDNRLVLRLSGQDAREHLGEFLTLKSLFSLYDRSFLLIHTLPSHRCPACFVVAVASETICTSVFTSSYLSPLRPGRGPCLSVHSSLPIHINACTRKALDEPLLHGCRYPAWHLVGPQQQKCKFFSRPAGMHSNFLRVSSSPYVQPQGSFTTLCQSKQRKVSPPFSVVLFFFFPTGLSLASRSSVTSHTLTVST